MHHGDGTRSSGGMSNPGFDPLGAGGPGSSNSHSSGERWREFADKKFNEFLQNCPGAHGDYTSPSTSPGHDDPPNNVCC